MKGFGVTSLGAVAAGQGLIGSLEACAPATGSKTLGPGIVPVTLRVNGKNVRVNIEPSATLAEVLHEQIGLTGTKTGCDRGACGACTVLLDGKAVCSCMTLAVDTVDQKIETIEGVGDDKRLHPIQQAFIESDAMQCGFCTPGMVLSCKALLDANPNPSDSDIRKAVSGNLCRCGTYPKIFQAMKQVAQLK